MIFDDIRLLISPIELQIPYKLYLSSDKDIEDAVYLWVLFREMLDGDLLQVQGEPYAIEFIYSDEDVGFIAVVPELPGLLCLRRDRGGGESYPGTCRQGAAPGYPCRERHHVMTVSSPL